MDGTYGTRAQQQESLQPAIRRIDRVRLDLALPRLHYLEFLDHSTN